MPSDSYYERLDEAEDKATRERKTKLIEGLYEMTLEGKVNFLIERYLENK